MGDLPWFSPVSDRCCAGSSSQALHSSSRSRDQLDRAVALAHGDQRRERVGEVPGAEFSLCWKVSGLCRTAECL